MSIQLYSNLSAQTDGGLYQIMQQTLLLRITHIGGDSVDQIGEDSDFCEVSPTTCFTHEGGTIGRANHCHLVLDDDSISREHAQIQVKNGQFVIADQDSTNGTWLNGERVLIATPIHSGDALVMGFFQFSVETRESAEKQASIEPMTQILPTHHDPRAYDLTHLTPEKPSVNVGYRIPLTQHFLNQIEHAFQKPNPAASIAGNTHNEPTEADNHFDHHHDNGNHNDAIQEDPNADARHQNIQADKEILDTMAAILGINPADEKESLPRETWALNTAHHLRQLSEFLIEHTQTEGTERQKANQDAQPTETNSVDAKQDMADAFSTSDDAAPLTI